MEQIGEAMRGNLAFADLPCVPAPLDNFADRALGIAPPDAAHPDAQVPSICSSPVDFALPDTVPRYFAQDVIQAKGMAAVEQVIAPPTDRLSSRPAVNMRCAAVPGSDFTIETPDNNAVRYEVAQFARIPAHRAEHSGKFRESRPAITILLYDV
nr:hypothetical protein [Sphingobium sp. SYK-6]